MLAYVSKNEGETRIALMREPKNAHDPNAIKIVGIVGKGKGRKTVCLGYLPTNEARILAPLMDAGKWVSVAEFAVVGGHSGMNYGAKLRLMF